MSAQEVFVHAGRGMASGCARHLADSGDTSPPLAGADLPDKKSCALGFA